MEWIQRDIKTEFNTKKDTYIKNLDEATERIIYHINKKSKIGIFTDFDVDGLGCYYVFDWFFKTINYDVRLKIPHRSEGYGINSNWINENSDLDLIITADNGIRAIEQVALAKSLGIDVIVTDHHKLGDILPDCLILNPKYESSSFTKELCGAGVSWYLVRRLIEVMSIDADPKEILDMVTISTIADLVELDGANRQIVKYGLRKINNGEFSNESIKLLFRNFKYEINTSSIAFGVAPILNAIGRLEDAKIGADYLTGNIGLYDFLIDNNEKRKDLQHKYTTKALGEIDNSKNIIIYRNNNIPKGLIGLTAGDIMNATQKPTVVIANNSGSGRSVNDISIYDLVFNSGNSCILSGGGHKKAIGVHISDYDKFKEEIGLYSDKNISEEDLKPRIYYWKIIKNNEFNSIDSQVQKMRPFGMKNLKPHIVLENQTISDYRIVGRNKNVLQLQLESGIKCVQFKYTEDERIKIGNTVKILGSTNDGQLIIKDIKEEI